MAIWSGARAVLILLLCWPPQEATPPASLRSPLVRAWSYLTADTLRYKGAVADRQNVYVPLAGGQILALKLTSGERVWTAHSEGDIATGLQVDDKAVYVTISSLSEAHQRNHSSLRALDTQTGEILWQRSFDQLITSLTHHSEAGRPNRGRLYVGTEAGSLMALDLSTKEPIWQFQTGDAIRGHVTEQRDVVYVGSDDGYLYALDAETGRQRWRFKTGGAVRAQVEVSRNRVFLGSFDGSVYCLDNHSGKRRWKRRTGAAIHAKPTLVNTTLIVASYDNFVYAFDSDSGTLRWKVKLSGRIMADPVARGNAVLVSTIRDHRVVVLQAEDGKEINSLDLGAGFEIVAPPVMAGQVLILTTDQGIIAARSVSPSDS